MTPNRFSISNKPYSFLAYSGIFLLCTAAILMLQNYIRYGGLPHYDPSIAYIYLSVSIIGFMPFVVFVIWIAKRFLIVGEKIYVPLSITTTVILVALFFFLSNAILHLLGYFDSWFDTKYARWYFGKEALIHTALVGANFFYVKRSFAKADDKIVIAVQGRKEVTIKASLIKWIESDDHYLKIHTGDNSLLKRTTMEKMAAELEPDFVRVHRKYIVNRKEVIGKEKAGKDEFLIMKTGTKIKVGRSYQPLKLFGLSV